MPLELRRYSDLSRHIKESQNSIYSLNFLQNGKIWKLRLCFIYKVAGHSQSVKIVISIKYFHYRMLLNILYCLIWIVVEIALWWACSWLSENMTKITEFSRDAGLLGNVIGHVKLVRVCFKRVYFINFLLAKNASSWRNTHIRKYWRILVLQPAENNPTHKFLLVWHPLKTKPNWTLKQ